MITLTIKKPGSLFPVLLEREITDAQHSMIALLLEQPELTYSEVVDFVRDHRHLVALANIYCVDDRHGVPCPMDKPDPCDEECDPEARVEAASQVEAARMAGWDEAYIADQVARGLMA